MKRLYALLFALMLLPAYAQNTQSQARVHTDLASRYYQAGQVATAVEEAQLALQSEADYVPAHTLLGLIYAQLRQNEQADTHFAAALSASDAQKISQTDVRNSYAWYLCNTQRGEQALQEFALVLRDPLYSSIDKALINAGVCAARLGHTHLALPYLGAAIDINPNVYVAYIYRAHVFISVARYNDARADIRKAQTLLSQTPEILWVQARFEHAQDLNQFKNTVAQLQRDFPISEQAQWAREELYNDF